FTMGNDSGDSDEKPAHEVDLDSFWIDQTEVTNAMYQLCVQAKKCNPPSDETYFGNEQYANYPVVYVSWNDASRYCAWAGRRLPTEAEWEKTARGVDRRVYPWGDEFSCKKGNFDDETKFDPYVVPGGPNCDGNEYLATVGSYTSGKSRYGALDMAGNVWEWVADWYSDTYYSNSPSTNPMGPASGKLKVLRGGSWSVSVNVVRSSNRYNFDPTTSSSDMGFRCAQDATP
ncbi:MAG: formylglycine-generating enzyme family protein, partial [Chloroflexota bacterium]